MYSFSGNYAASVPVSPAYGFSALALVKCSNEEGLARPALTSLCALVARLSPLVARPWVSRCAGLCRSLLQWPLSPPRARIPLEFGCSRQFHTGGCYSFDCPASPERRRPSAASFRPRTHSDGPVSQTLLTSDFKRRELLRAFGTLDDSTPQ